MARCTVFLAVLAAVTIAFVLNFHELPAFADESSSQESQPGPQAASVPVALLDVGFVIKKHRGFHRQLEQMKKDLQEVEARFQLERAKDKAFEERLKKLVVGSDEYLELEEKITAGRSALQARIASEKRRFTRQEAAVYAEVYKEIRGAVSDYSQEKGIRLVLRFNREPMNESDPNSVMRSVNRDIVFEDGLDISDEILRRVNAGEPSDVNGF